MYKEIFVKLYPYLGCSTNLIEFFAIIGYDEKLLEENINLDIYENKALKLSVISTIISESFHNEVNFEDIIKKIYPDKPNIIQISKTVTRKPKSTNVILSSCIDSVNGDKKICYSCYAMRFYEKYKHKDKMEYYVPKAFLFYSQYPFFNTFYNICYKIHIYNEFYMEDSLPLEILIYCLVNYIPNPIKNRIVIEDFKPNITIPKLSGYPYLDFNLCEIFNSIPIKEFIKIFILAFLELETLFFSPNLEKLNLFMYMLYILNYPLTDSNYFWHIKSISKNDINSVGEMIGSIFLGVNTEFNNKTINTQNLSNVNYIVNLENKKNTINFLSNTKESEELNKLIKYIHNLLTHKESRSFFLGESLIYLKRALKRIKQVYDSKVCKKELDSFFYVDKIVMEINRLIQEAFYDFILTFLIFLKNDYLYDYSSFSIIKNKNNQNYNEKFTEEENIFLKYFRFTIKYSTYFDNFISYFNTFDEFKISLLITEEFVDLKEKNINKILNGNNVSYFKIMDNLYETKGIKYKVNFNNINQEFKLDTENNKISNIKKENQLFFINKDIINDFLNYKNNKILFKMFQLEVNNEQALKSIKMINISNIIQNYFAEFLNDKYYIYSSIVYVISIIFPLFTFDNNILFFSNLLYRLQKMKYFQRFHINILLKSFNKYYFSNQENYHFSGLNFENFKNYCDLVQGHLIKNRILPNEEIYNFYQKLYNEAKNKEKTSTDNGSKIKDNQFIYEYDENDNHINNFKEGIITREKNMLVLNYKGIKIITKLNSYNIIFQQISLYYEDYFMRLNFNIELINPKGIIDIIINIIYYTHKYQHMEMSCLLLDGIILLKKLENQIKTFRKKIGSNNNKMNININNDKGKDVNDNKGKDTNGKNENNLNLNKINGNKNRDSIDNNENNLNLNNIKDNIDKNIIDNNDNNDKKNIDINDNNGNNIININDNNDKNIEKNIIANNDKDNNNNINNAVNNNSNNNININIKEKDEDI